MSDTVTSWTAACQASLSFTISQSLIKSSPLTWWCYLTISSSVIPFSSCPQSFPASGSFLMSQLLHQMVNYWSFSFSISPSSDYSELISFKINWFDLLSVQETLNTTVQKHQFFGAQLSALSNSHIHTWPLETIALTRRAFVGKVMSLLFNKLSRLVMAFLPRSKRLLISWLLSPSSVILEPPQK